MSTRFLAFISIVTGILCILAFYTGTRFIRWSSWASDHRGVVWLILALFVFLQLLGPFLYRLHPDHSGRGFVLHWITYTTLGLFASLFFYTFAVDLFLSVWKLFRPDHAVDLQRRGFLAVVAMTLGSVVIGVSQAVRGPKIFEVDIPIENLPEELEGFRIAQISDLHVGPTIGRKYTEQVVQMVNGLSPDIIALTGDFVDGSVARLRSALEPIATLRAKHGTFFVTGNHEYYWGVREWLEEFRKLGARILLNEHVVINEQGKELVIAGVTDLSAGHMLPGHESNPKKSLEGAPDQGIKILLAHQPATYKDAYDAGFHLQLSGHTHGGQFFPWNLVVKLAQRYYKGLNKHEKMWVYVNRGAGYWGPPHRFTVPAEISLLKLVRA
ncbi:metallophosphoesterase [bacterium]|nr:metallophosphoesterase [bacterium]